MQVTIEALLQLCNILHSHNPPDADLLALLLVGERFRHAGWAGLSRVTVVVLVESEVAR